MFNCHTYKRVKMAEPWKIIFLIFFTLYEPTSTSNKDDQIPLQTPEPLNIITTQTRLLFTHNPLTFQGNDQENAYLRNNGVVVKVDLFENNTTNVVTGGPLNDTIYVYTETKFYWANGTNEVAYTTVDEGNGTPLEVAIIYYNTKYKSHYDALNYRDGIAEILFRIKIGSKSNPEFEPFAAAMKKIQKPGPPVEIKLQDTFSWFFNIPKYTGYFEYLGSQTNETLGKMFYCSTTMAVDLNQYQYTSISKIQFEETFLKLLNTEGKPLFNQVHQYPQGSRRVTRWLGIFKRFSDKLYPSII